MKTQFKRLSKSTLAVVLSVCLLISCMTVGLIATDAAKTAEERVGAVDESDAVGYSYTFNGGQIYFDASRTGYSTNHTSKYFYLAAINSDSTWIHKLASMTNITNTGLYYSVISSFNLESNPRFGVVVASSALGDGWLSSGFEHVYYVGSDYTFNSNDNYLTYKSAIANGALTTGAASGGSTYSDGIDTNTSYKYAQSVYAQYKNIGGSYTSGTTGGTVQISGYKWKNGTTVESTTANHNGSITAVRTTSATLSNTPASGYTFDGWYTTSSGSTTISTPITNITATHSAYGRFSENANTVTFTKKLGSNAATTMDTKSAGVTTKASYTAPDESGYEFTGWTITSGSGNASNASATNNPSVTTFQLNATGAVTVQANYQVAVAKHDVTFTSNPTGGTVKVNNSTTSPQEVEENTDFTVKLTPSTGYTVNTFTVGGVNKKSELTGNDSSGWTYTGNVGTSDKEVVATFSKKSYTISWTNATDQHTFTVKKTSDNSTVNNGDSVEYGTNLTVTVTGYSNSSDTIYIINSITGQTLTSPSGSGTQTYTGTFNVPASNVTMTASSTATYKVTISKDSGVNSVTVKKTNASGATVSNGSYVPTGTALYVSAVMNEGKELNTSTPSLTKASSTTTSITYTGTSAAINAPYTVNVTSKSIAQSTVTLNTTSNIESYTIAYTKNKASVSATAYSSPVTVDNGTTVTVVATPKGRATITKWTVNGTDNASTSKTYTSSAISSNTTISATAEKSNDVIYIKPYSSMLGGDIYYYTWNSSDQPTSGAWPGTKIWNGSSVPSEVSSTVYYDSSAGVFCVDGLTSGQGIKFRGGEDTYQTDDQTVQFGKTYVLTTDSNWTSTVKDLGDLTDTTVIYVNKTVVAQGYTKNIGGIYTWWGDEKQCGDWASNITGNSLPSGITKEDAEIDGTAYWKITIPNYKFTSQTDRKFNAKFKIDDWNPDTTEEHYNLIVGKAYVFDVTYNSNDNGWTVGVEETSKEEETGDKYFLAGQYTDGSTQFFGGQWNTGNNQLIKSGSVYTKTFTNNIPAGTIEFKVVKNGDTEGWDEGSWPAENQSYVIRENATSVTFTFDPNTHTTTVTQTNSGGGAAGVWTPGDKYTSSGTPSGGAQKVADTPDIGSNTSSGFYFVWADNDNGPGKSGTTAISVVKNDNGGYWADITTQAKANSNFFFALSNNNSNSGIRGNNGEKINCVVKSAGNSTTMYDSSGASLMVAEMKERSEVSGSAYYMLLRGVDWDKVSNVGVMAYYNGSEVDYQFYYKLKAVTPADQVKLVDICAKDGTLRDDTFNRFARLATTTIDNTYFDYTDDDGNHYTSIAAYNDAKDDDIVITRESYGGTDAGYTKMVNVPVGAKIKVKTTLSDNASATGSFNNTAFKNTHYVKGYSFNGMTYQVNEWESDGVYEEIWTVRAVNTTYKDSNGVERNATTDGKTIEVTPIYYMKDNTNCKTFYIDGYDGTVQNAWGNMLAVYPYYEGKSNKDNAFGGYPGQPMLLWGGKYQMEIPLTVDGTASGASVKGLTLHNAYWDLLHRSVDIRCNARNHAQTYDYDDFYKLYKEKNPDTIIFDFKYRTAEDNYNDGYDYTRYTFADGTTRHASDYTGSGHNGVEIVTDYFGRQVDAFGTLIADGSKSHYGEDDGDGGTVGQTNEILFVSTGYKDTYVGEYATIWAVYKPNGDFIGYISSSMLYLNNIDRRLQYTGGDSTASGRMSWSNYISTYNTLKSTYTGVPALIVYDKEIWNDSKDKANRSDGKWYYSNKSDKISASIKIQYGAYSLFEAPDHSVSSDAWRDDPFSDSKTGVGGEKNIGTNTGCSAYFTNSTPNLLGKVASGEQFADSTKKFTFQAVPSGSYMFAGWVRYSNGKYYEITENEIGESPMSSNDVYIARFVTAKTGTLTVQHVVEQTDEYNGTGTPALTVTVKDGSGNNVSGSPFTVSDGSKIDISKWIDIRNATYTIDISLGTTPTNDSFMKNITSSSGNYAASPNTWNGDYDKTSSSGADTAAKTATVAQFTVQEILDSGITNLRYVSHLMKPVYNYQYEIIYTYYSRFWGVQSYTQEGTCAEGDFTGSTTSATLTTDFIIDKTPYEKNFREEINWNYTNSTVEAGDYDAPAMVNNAAVAAESANTYKMTAHVYASKAVNDRVSAEFVLPYNHTDKAAGAQIIQGDMYTTEGAFETTTNIYDTSYESVKLTTQAYKLFTYDGSDVGGGSDTHATDTALIEAAPYVIKDANWHRTYTTKNRYFSSGNDQYPDYQSFDVNGTTYWLDNMPDGETGTVLTSADTQTSLDGKSTIPYAVKFTNGTADQYDDELYYFINVGQDNVQYIYSSWINQIDGIIHDEDHGAKWYFTRWDVYTTKGDYVASCYNRRFNYSGYDNYIVKPIYESTEEQNYNSSSGANSGTMASITYLGDTRNQWNGGAKGDYATVTGKSDGNTAGDKLIHDFALAYAYNGLEIQTIPNTTDDPTNGHNIKIGMIIEQLDALDSAGGTKITDSSYYAEKYNKSSNLHRPEVDLPKITNWLNTPSGKLSDAVGHTCINSKIGNNVDNSWGNKFGTSGSGTNAMSFDSVIDNFNRLQWFYTFTNTKIDGEIGPTNNANFAYRAWAYIIVDGAATVSSTPTYFTLYDSAHR